MEIIQTTYLNDLNRVLLAIHQLVTEDKKCSINGVKELCSSISLSGHIIDYWHLVRICNFMGFISIEGSSLKLLPLGEDFLELNNDAKYEINTEQSEFLVDNLILDGPWQKSARGLLQTFSPNYDELTYEFDLGNKNMPRMYNPHVQLFRRLGILVEKDRFLRVTPQYAARIARLLDAKMGQTQTQLEDALIRNQKQGARAEEMVVKFEKARLEFLGHQVEASLVRRISELRVDAGYDLESFDGINPLFDYNRFIEVKSSYESKLKFYWSYNEIQKALALGDRYWIYFVGGFKENNLQSIEPIMIQNPAKKFRIQQSVDSYVFDGIAVTSTNVLVEQKENLLLQLIKFGDISCQILS